VRRIIIPLLLLTLILSACTNPSDGQTTGASSTTTITNVGSDTMVNLALAWAEAYQTENPSVQLSVTGGGSGSGIAALINGTVDIANASRGIKTEEQSEAQAAGFTPFETVVARDAIAIIVNPANPVQHLTLEQLSLIYRGFINNWSEVGGEDAPIVRLSRESNSGTHVYFLEQVVRLGNPNATTIFCPETLLLPSSEGIIAEVSDNPNAIGYDGLGYVTTEVKVIGVGTDPEGPFVFPSVETVNNGEYPISRDLYMYTQNEPSGAILAYINWILSPAGQQIVADLGFVPVNSTQEQ
jgi:phosphate transport system substrate-binding protein